MSRFHPDLAPRARWLMRGTLCRGALPFLRGVTWWGAVLRSRCRPLVPLDGGALVVHRPAEPSNGLRPGILWIHGGGLVLGDARQDEGRVQRFSDELGAVVVSSQYRLAPEHPFPTPLDDVERAFRWLADQPDVDPTRLAVAGVSAGGGLAAALCQRLRDADADVRPIFQLLIYPMLDDRSADGTGPTDAGQRVWSRRDNAEGWASYLGDHDRDAPPPHAVPARTEDLSGLPAAWIGVGTLDLFHGECVTYANGLRAGGAPVEVVEIDGAYHGFDVIDARAAVSRAFVNAQVEALADALVR